MEILSVKLSGFKNIHKANLSISNMMALLSLNNYGKSNLLKGLDFAFEFIKLPSEVKTLLMNQRSNLPLNNKHILDNFSVEFEFATTFNSEPILVIYGFEFSWKSSNDGDGRIINEFLKIRFDDKGQRFSSYISRDNNEAYYKASPSGRCTNKIKIKSNELILNKLRAYDDLFYIDIIEEIHVLKVYIERHLDAARPFEFMPILKVGCDESDLKNTSYIPRLVYLLKERYEDKYSLLMNSFQQLFPQILYIQVRKYSVEDFFEDLDLNLEDQYTFSDAEYRIFVKDKNLKMPVNFEEMSDGAKRVFLMLVYVIYADINGYSLLAIEEPENSVHPSLLQDYLRTISQLLGKCKIIISSHSPYLVNYLQPDSVYIGLPNDFGIANFCQIDKKKVNRLYNDASEMGLSTGEYMFELLSSATEEIDRLNDYLVK